MKQKELTTIWFKNAERKWAATKTLFRGKHYVECLFFCHLSLELYLKSLLILSGSQTVPHSHDLGALSERINLPFTEEMIKNLEQINEFNIRARYDEHKRNLYQKATQSFTKHYLDLTESILVWLKRNTPQAK